MDEASEWPCQGTDSKIGYLASIKGHTIGILL